MIPVRPYKDRVLVRVHPAETLYDGPIIAPSEDFLLGEIKWRLADVIRSAVEEVPEGAQVIIERDSGTMLFYEGTQYRVLFPSSILAIIES